MDEHWQVPRWVEALIPELDGCIELDDGVLAHLQEMEVYELPQPETPEWVQAAIEARPGVWTARLCRAMHGVPETEQGIAYCGLCVSYVNPRKRRRAACLPNLLPGFAEGAYMLRQSCSKRDLTWLRRTVCRLCKAGKIVTRRERIPDVRQARGWDIGTRIYPG
jgi:hypothetical protein